jgi:transposase-like protein
MSTQNEETVIMKCRNPKCDSITAVQVKIPGRENIRMYRCVKCNQTFSINVGGQPNWSDL